ncbi:MAG: NAD(P)/FAD-dependent oxidoreductase [Eubacteriales bacterium]
MYRISGIKLAVYEDKSFVKEKLEKLICGKNGNIEIVNYKIVRESLDARRKPDIFKVYTLDFQTKQKLSEKIIKKHGITCVQNSVYKLPESGIQKMHERPVIVGFGPAGMFAGLILAEKGYRPIIFERGEITKERVKSVEKFFKTGELNIESNVQFGEGGAGTFSDGKLGTQIRDLRIRKVLETFVECGAPEDILYSAKPHIGTDVLRKVVVNLRNRIQELGGTIKFCSKLSNLQIEQDCGISRIKKIVVNDEEVLCSVLILAIGHSARDTVTMLFEKGVKMLPKQFSIGIRVEHPQKLIDLAQYGGIYDEIGAADYKLSYRCDNSKRGVYSFCMCPGGEVIVASSEKGMVVTNGMSNRARSSGFANSAILVDVKTSDFGSDDVLAGIEFQRKFEKRAFENGGGNYTAPSCTWEEFKKNENAGKIVRQCLPNFAVDSILEAFPNFGKKIKKFDCDNAKIFAVESRSSSPVRIVRDENFESSVKGIYPVGEGAGYAGGITSSAVDGIKIAETIIKKYEGVF